MNIACIGGGPAGLYLGILVKRRAPEHEVVIFERNRPTDTFGFGVVFSDATLGNLAAADPESHAQITSRFARWDDIEIHVGGEGNELLGLKLHFQAWCGGKWSIEFISQEDTVFDDTSPCASFSGRSYRLDLPSSDVCD